MTRAFWILLSTVPLVSSAQRGDNPDTLPRPPGEQQTLFHVPPGFAVQLVASEPEIQKPMNLAFDAAGRVWVTGSSLYPWPARRDANGNVIEDFQKNWDDNQLAFRALSSPPTAPEHGTDSVRVLSDFGPDGRARKASVFADGLNIPIGIVPLPRAPGAKGDTAVVFSIPAIWRLTDTNGDGRADVREKLYDGFGFKDTHGMSSSYWLWVDGWIYGTHGFANVSEVRDRQGRVVTLRSGNTYRFRPDGSKFEIFAHGQTNPFGLAFDARGDVYTADSHSKPVYLLLPGGYYEGIGVYNQHDGLGFAPAITDDAHGSSAIAGIAHYTAVHFPPEFRGNLFNGNPVTRRVNRVRLDWQGSTPRAVRQPDFLTCDDRAFRPVQVKLGPDGALWIADFYNPIIGHYEAPLTHPARDRAHGRVWRIVWRGLDGSVAAPTLPNLAVLPTKGLAGKLADSNLMVRSLAVSELLMRADAAIAVPELQTRAARIVSGAADAGDPTVLLPVKMTLARLGAGDDARLRRAIERGESDVAVAALRVLAERESLNDSIRSPLEALFAEGRPDMTARAAAVIFQRAPQPWQVPLVLSLLEQVPEYDAGLRYALRLALKSHAAKADAAELRAWADSRTSAAEHVADVCLAVKTPAAADFLLDHLERTNFEGKRAGEFARHAVRELSAERISAVQPLLQSMASAPLEQRLALAEGFAAVAEKRSELLPADVHAWMERQLVDALAARENALRTRALAAMKPLNFAGKALTLRTVALNHAATAAVRSAALRALSPENTDSRRVLMEVVSSPAPTATRKIAAQLLGEGQMDTEVVAALSGAFADAPADLAVTLAAALARSDPSAEQLLNLVAASRAPASVLRHRHVETELDKRAAVFRDRVRALTRDLPAEDARIDALIAARLQAYPQRKTDPARGAALFAQHCALCHKFKDTGGSLGPGLDGIGAREVARLFEDILDPSRNVDPAFRLVTVTLKNGEARSGMNHREEHGRLLMTDPATGHTIELPASEVKEVRPAPLSAMPAAFESVLSESEFFDVVDYMRGEKR